MSPISRPNIPPEPTTGPRYTLLHKSYIHGRIKEEGDHVHFDGEPGGNLVPYVDPMTGKEDEEARAAVDKVKETRERPLPTDGRYIGNLIEQNYVNGGKTEGRVDTATRGIAGRR